MTEPKQLLLYFLLLFLFSTVKVSADTSCCDCLEDELYVIRSSGSGGQLVLDSSEPPQVRIQYFTGYRSQLWQFIRGTRAGLYYIISNYTGNALDFAEKESTQLRMGKRKNTLNQQWDLALNGRIINASIRKSVGIQGANYNGDTLVILSEDNGEDAQKFDLQLMDIRPNYELCSILLR